jgi:hypothetical protein
MCAGSQAQAVVREDESTCKHLQIACFGVRVDKDLRPLGPDILAAGISDDDPLSAGIPVRDMRGMR